MIRDAHSASCPLRHADLVSNGRVSRSFMQSPKPPYALFLFTDMSDQGQHMPSLASGRTHVLVQVGSRIRSGNGLVGFLTCASAVSCDRTLFYSALAGCSSCRQTFQCETLVAVQASILSHTSGQSSARTSLWTALTACLDARAYKGGNVGATVPCLSKTRTEVSRCQHRSALVSKRPGRPGLRGSSAQQLPKTHDLAPT